MQLTAETCSRSCGLQQSGRTRLVPRRVAPFSRASGSRRWQPAPVATSATKLDEPTPLDSIALRSIENLDSEYCDDFVCTSSPAIEQTVRSLARELQRGRYATTSLYQREVQYSDGFRSFSGPDGYMRQRWIADCIQKPQATIVKMRMLDKGTSQIEWRVAGQLGAAGGVDIGFTTTCEHNLLTGRITSHKESWSLSKCSPPAAALATLSRMSWSAKVAVEDAKDGMSKQAQKLGGDQGGAAGPNMADPTRFYQQPDSGPQQDYIAIGFLVALLYLAFKLFGELERLG